MMGFEAQTSPPQPILLNHGKHEVEGFGFGASIEAESDYGSSAMSAMSVTEDFSTSAMPEGLTSIDVKKDRGAWAEIDLKAFKSNVKTLKEKVATNEP